MWGGMAVNILSLQLLAHFHSEPTLFWRLLRIVMTVSDLSWVKPDYRSMASTLSCFARHRPSRRGKTQDYLIC